MRKNQEKERMARESFFFVKREIREKNAYSQEIKKIEEDIKELQKRINEKMGVKETDTGLSPPNLWDIPADKSRMQQEQPLQV